jgi:Glycosyl transferase family 2
MPMSQIRRAPQAAAKSLLRPALEGRRLMIFEARNKLVRGYASRSIKRFEDAEVARLAAELGQLPVARVATVITTYRRPELLRRAVESVLAQTMRDQVVIVVDDAGGLSELPEDPRLFACSLSANVAIAGVVRNVGIRLTRSTYVAFLDDDNEWEPDHLEAALAALEGERAGRRPDLVYTAVQRALPDGTVMDVLSTPFDRRRLLNESFFDVNAVVARRIPGLVFSRLTRPKGGTPAEDWEMIFRLCYWHRMRMEHVPVKTVRYLVHPQAYWSNWDPSQLS